MLFPTPEEIDNVFKKIDLLEGYSEDIDDLKKSDHRQIIKS